MDLATITEWKNSILHLKVGLSDNTPEYFNDYKDDIKSQIDRIQLEKKTNSFTKNTLIKTNSKNTKSNISELPENYSTLLIGKERKISFYQQTVNKNKFDRKDIEMSTFNSKKYQ